MCGRPWGLAAPSLAVWSELRYLTPRGDPGMVPAPPRAASEPVLFGVSVLLWAAADDLKVKC